MPTIEEYIEDRSRQGYDTRTEPDSSKASPNPWKPPRNISEVRDQMEEVYGEPSKGMIILGEGTNTALSFGNNVLKNKTKRGNHGTKNNRAN
ncbi:hypothetical protein C922_05791 [Plasmodium inui San Antonio 1]|uniref:Uncharacterized protein n=1 Tax=Plasmodium inui San Antonio 1 TaxID=1237626 RepID=W6ZSE5_9APIC|nr:hypothetical protein C922_05791 [Plasmodium inui San Antonio 1]EUD63827.1 hypothetical protein C922_05791 [Plasmodium inui San Antonio 1]